MTYSIPRHKNFMTVVADPEQATGGVSPESMACGCKCYIVCVTHRDMRNWVRERMKRRKKKQPEGEAEATGKVGQQKPPVDELHPEPLVPSYGTEKADTSGATPSIIEAPGHGRRMETEVQPESPSTPPPGAPEQRPAQAQKSARPPKGVVVLAIGLPGSG